MSPIAWGALGVSVGVVTAVFAAVWTHTWFMDDILDVAVTQLRYLRGLIGR
jgi:hypothetical protein